MSDNIYPDQVWAELATSHPLGRQQTAAGCGLTVGLSNVTPARPGGNQQQPFVLWHERKELERWDNKMVQLSVRVGCYELSLLFAQGRAVNLE